jgi:hypothetical protein
MCLLGGAEPFGSDVRRDKGDKPMLTKSKIILAAVILLSAASSAMAASKHSAAQTYVPQWNDAAHSYARAPQISAAPAGHVIVDGMDQGWDPDPLVRLDLLRDPPYAE